MPTITDKTEFSDQDVSRSQAGAGGSPVGESPAPPRSRRKRSSSGLREQLPDELIDELLALFGGRTQPVMAHLIESGKLTINDVREAEKALREMSRKEKP